MNRILIARYMAGESDNREKEEIEQWLQSNPDNRALMEEFFRIWNMTGESYKGFEEFFDPEEDWEKMRSRLIAGHKTEDNTASKSNMHRGRTPRARFSQFMRVAAIIVVAGLIGALVFWNVNYNSAEPADPVLREIAMERGQRGNITLSDGTKVKLNAESKIILPNVFESDRRMITLHGEAFFEVSPNPDRPFIINSGEAVVEVLGTSLNVRSYPEDKSVSVVVKEGRVSLKSRKDFVQDTAVLATGEMGQLFWTDNSIKTARVDDPDLFLSWTEGYLKFKDAPLSEVARRMERKYDIEISFNSSDLKERNLTAEFKSRSIRYNLDVLATSLDIGYEMDQQKVILYEK